MMDLNLFIMKLGHILKKIKFHLFLFVSTEPVGKKGI